MPQPGQHSFVKFSHFVNFRFLFMFQPLDKPQDALISCKDLFSEIIDTDLRVLEIGLGLQELRNILCIGVCIFQPLSQA